MSPATDRSSPFESVAGERQCVRDKAGAAIRQERACTSADAKNDAGGGIKTEQRDERKEESKGWCRGGRPLGHCAWIGGCGFRGPLPSRAPDAWVDARLMLMHLTIVRRNSFKTSIPPAIKIWLDWRVPTTYNICTTSTQRIASRTLSISRTLLHIPSAQPRCPMPPASAMPSNSRTRRVGAVVLSIFALQRHGGRHPTADGFAPRPSRRDLVRHRSSMTSSSSSVRLARGAGGYEQRRDESSIIYGEDYGYDEEEDVIYDESHDGDHDDDDLLQQERLSSSIGCPHFGTCPGCVRDSDVAEVDVVESARLYFSSPSVRKHVAKPRDRHAGYADDDDFYRIRVPSPIAQWRTQA